MSLDRVGFIDVLKVIAPTIKPAYDLINGPDRQLHDKHTLTQKERFERLDEYVNGQLEQDYNVFILIDGPTQMGKSTFAIQYALYRKQYELHHVVFGIDQLRDLLNKNPPENSVIIYDDPQTEYNSQDWQQKRVKQLTRIAQTMGYRHYVFVLTTPSIDSLPSQVYPLVTLWLQGDDDKKGFFWTKKPKRKRNRTLKNKDIYFSYLAVKNPETLKYRKLKYIYGSRLPDNIYAAYHKKKTDFLEKIWGDEPEKAKKELTPAQKKQLADARAKNPNHQKKAASLS